MKSIRSEQRAQLLRYIEEARFLNSLEQGERYAKVSERMDYVISCMETLVNKIVGEESNG